MLERIRHPELCEFIDEIQNAVTCHGPIGTDVPAVVAEKNAILDELLPNIVRSNFNSARLDRMHRRDQAVRWAGRRSNTLANYVHRALMPPGRPAAVAVTPAAPPINIVPAVVLDAPAASAKIRVEVSEKSARGGFIADVTIPDFCERYLKDATHKRFKALGREWRVELMRTKQGKQKPGFWLTLLDGKPFTASFAFTVQGPDGVPEGQNSKTNERTWIAGGDAAGWGYSWEKYNVDVYEDSTGTSQWVDKKGTLRLRVDLTRGARDV